MEDTIKIRKYEKRVEKDLNGNDFYVLSFETGSHLKISKKAMAIIELLNGKLSTSEVVEVLNKEGISITLKELEYFIFDFLLPRNVLQGEDTNVIKMNNNKLWFHLPIIESKRFGFLYKCLQVLLNKLIVTIMLIAISICVFISIIYLLNYKGDFVNEVNSVQILLLVYLSMFVHEIGHATAAYKYGVNVGKIGIGIYLIYFIFFIDMTNTWKLSKRERIVNDLSGIYFQMILIIFVFTTFIFTQSISLLCAVLIILCTSLMNFMPFLRMDGYWLLTDYLGMQNVQMKSITSITAAYKELIYKISACFKHQKYNVDRQNMFYGIYSLVYISSTAIMLSFISFSVIKILMNFDDLTAKFISLYNSITQGQLNMILLDLNNLFILILPLIFILLLIVSIINKYIRKKLIERKVRKK